MPKLSSNPAEIEQHLATLEATVTRIRAATKGFSDAELAEAAPKAWSVNQILAHLRGCADVWTQSIYIMLALDNPTMPIVGGRDMAKVTGYDQLPFKTSFQAFSLQRAELLLVLRKLDAKGWARTSKIGNHTHSVFSQTRRLALHEFEHCDQIEAMLKK